MDETIQQLKQDVADLAAIVYNHRHLGFDLTTPLNLPGTGSISKPAGNTTEVQYNDNGAFGSSVNFTFDKSAGGNVNIQPNQGGGQVAISGADGAAGTGDGGQVIIFGGDPDFGHSGTGAGGEVQILGGASNNNAAGAAVTIDGGDGYINANGNGDGGAVVLSPGNGQAGAGGELDLYGGSSTGGGAGGNVVLSAGSGAPNGKIKLQSGFSTPAQSYTPSAAGTATLDLTLANEHRIQMPAGNITVALVTATDAQKFIISITQDSGGSRTVTWFTTIRWAGGVAPTLTTTANKRDTFGFIRTGANTYDGFIVGQNI